MACLSKNLLDSGERSLSCKSDEELPVVVPGFTPLLLTLDP